MNVYEKSNYLTNDLRLLIFHGHHYLEKIEPKEEKELTLNLKEKTI